jgi:hypothetical protein
MIFKYLVIRLYKFWPFQKIKLQKWRDGANRGISNLDRG